MRATRTTEPKTHAATLKELKDHLKIRQDSEDALLVRRLISGTSMIENVLQTSLITQAWRLVLDAWDFDEQVRKQKYEICLPHGPIISPITSVKYYTADGVEVLLSSSAYVLDVDLDRLMLASGWSWPTDIRPERSMVIEYGAGYGAGPGSVPQELRDAVVKAAAWLHVHPDAQKAEAALPAEIFISVSHRLRGSSI